MHTLFLSVAKKTLKNKQKALFFQQFAALLQSGITVKQSLIMAAKDGDISFYNYLQKVSIVVDAGQDLASALTIGDGYFDSWTISLLRLGEQNGFLVKTCQMLANSASDEQRQERLYNSIKLTAITTIWSLLTLVAAIFMQTPSAILKPEFWIRSFGIGLLLLGVSVLISRYKSQRFQQLMMKLPIVGKIIQNSGFR
ncbi:MAG: bacterial type II secretion system protein F domain protein, partial [Moorea sp. SIO2B7]|nr:bacterial type II secretion system protein F domain protein [Moorena sp. SIO2B7]